MRAVTGAGISGDRCFTVDRGSLLASEGTSVLFLARRLSALTAVIVRRGTGGFVATGSASPNDLLRVVNTRRVRSIAKLGIVNSVGKGSVILVGQVAGLVGLSLDRSQVIRKKISCKGGSIGCAVPVCMSSKGCSRISTCARGSVVKRGVFRGYGFGRVGLPDSLRGVSTETFGGYLLLRVMGVPGSIGCVS